MNLESKIPGISAIVAIENIQERLNAIQEVFNTSDHGSSLVDILLQEMPEKSFAAVPVVEVAQSDVATAQVVGRSASIVGRVWPFKK